MLAGPLRYQVMLQKPTLQRVQGGAPVSVYSDWVFVYAAIEPLTPREYLAAQAINSDISVKIRIRFRPGLDATLRVYHRHGPGSPQQEDLYDVIGPPVEVLTNRTEVWLMCKLRDTPSFRTGDPQ